MNKAGHVLGDLAGLPGRRVRCDGEILCRAFDPDDVLVLLRRAGRPRRRRTLRRMARRRTSPVLGGGLTAQAAAPARTTGAAVELAPAGALATQCYYKVNADGGSTRVLTETRAEDTVPSPSTATGKPSGSRRPVR